MESAGVILACRNTDTKFLVVKAVQDPGTAEKDARGQKDLWRTYAAEAAAAFTVGLIRRFELADEAAVTHMREVRRVSALLEAAAPVPKFEYTVRWGESYGALRAQERSSGVHIRGSEPESLIPHAGRPLVALHGGGGTGKTRILQSLIPKLLKSDICPLLVDLKLYTRSLAAAQASVADTQPEIVRHVLATASVPRRTVGEIERLVRDLEVVVLIDGVNEVSARVRTAILDHFQLLRHRGQCYILAADRFGPLETLPTFSHAAVDRLGDDFVRDVLDRTLGRGTYETLDPALRRIYGRPFFLKLALRSGRAFDRARTWNDIFAEFFREHLGMEDSAIRQVADAALEAQQQLATFDFQAFRARIGESTYDALLQAGILQDTEGREFDFDHDLWRDYLVSRSLSSTLEEDRWTSEVFDAATTLGVALECLPLALGQLDTRQRKDDFLKRVYNWNYPAAAECLSELRPGDPEALQVSPEIRICVLAVIAERRFDPVRKTRQRAEEVLQDHRYDFAEPFRGAASADALRQHIGAIVGEQAWFNEWKRLFSRADGHEVMSEEIALIASNDPLIGWVTANLVRRSDLGVSAQSQLRGMFESYAGDDAKTVRWESCTLLGSTRLWITVQCASKPSTVICTTGSDMAPLERSSRWPQSPVTPYASI
jgi:hypothetical protein